MAKRVDNPLEAPFDFGLVNYVKHPTNPSYIVFRYKDKNRADFFETKLKENNIWFEKDQQMQEGKVSSKIVYLYGIHVDDYKKVSKLNYDTEAANRSYLIKNNGFRWILLIVVGMFVAAAIVGAIIGR